MTRRDRICYSVYLSALGVWAGVLAMTAAAAAVTFPTVRSLDPTLLDLDPTSRPHWMLVGGKVVSGVFVISHAAQAVCALLAITSFVLLCRSSLRGRQSRRSVTFVSTAAALSILSWYLLVLWPRMRENLHTYWDNLFAGKLDLARAAQLAFDADHPNASLTLQVLLAAVLVALTSGVWSATAPPGSSK
ncbi:MAG: hypothetical protein Q8L55_01145 [Phycisphaerales bacterium]|nr:hypothetical protein [Phycisphaerales bacterium]